MVAAQAPDYLIEKIIPTRSVHLLAGISSAGKSRWSYPAFVSWSMGFPVMGLKSYPVPWCLVSCDRPLHEVETTLKSMGIPPSEVPIIPAFGQYNKSSTEIMREIEAIGAKFVLWEGIDLMVDNPNHPAQVRIFLSTLTAHCERGLTVLGTTGVPKLKPNETYQNPRQLVAGSTLWERATSSNLIIAPVDEQDVENPCRIMYACLKNQPSFIVRGSFDVKGALTFNDWDKREVSSATVLNSFKNRRQKGGESIN